MTELKFYTYLEACQKLSDEKGGAMYRYGSQYPIYVYGAYGWQKRFDGGSAGEMIMTRDYNGQSTSPSSDEQKSINWVIFSKSDWEAREKAMADAWADIHKRQAEEQARRATQQRPKGFFARIFGLG